MRALLAARSDEDRRRAWDDFDARPAESGETDPAAAVVCRLGGEEGETVTSRPGRRVTLLSDTEELAVSESVYGPGERGPELHVHREHTDAWLVLEGALTFELRDGLGFEAPAGTLVIVPPHVAHGFSNEQETTARFLQPACAVVRLRRVHAGEEPGVRPARPARGRWLGSGLCSRVHVLLSFSAQDRGCPSWTRTPG